MGNEPCADNYGPVNVMELRERIFQETEREKAQDYLWNELVLLQSQTFRTVKHAYRNSADIVRCFHNSDNDE